MFESGANRSALPPRPCPRSQHYTILLTGLAELLNGLRVSPRDELDKYWTETETAVKPLMELAKQ